MIRKVFLSLSILPLLFMCLSVSKITDGSAVYVYSGLSYDSVSRFFPGAPASDVSYGVISEALGRRAALDVLSGKLPLWNHYEGFGTPLLGEMQSAALFPPTWLLAFPHGQALELGLLQILAGLGTYLFLRKFGICSKLALAGAVLFQFNGVFAWLHNAVSNSVVFLPWLFLAVELLYIAANDNARRTKRLPGIALGGMAAALAIYAGFPEVVYLYSLLLLVWALFRFFALNRPVRLRFVLDLGLVCLVGLFLSLPVLLAFASFLPEATLGAHNHNGFYGVYLPPSALLRILLPYVYGPIFAAKNPVIHLICLRTGGYIGLVPCVLAVAALFFPKRRAIKLLAVSWIALAVGTTFGVPGIYQTFHWLPLMKTMDSSRYLNASWIFCFVILAGLALNDIRQAKISDVRRALGKAIALVVVLLTVAAALAWPVLAQLGAEELSIRRAAVLSAGAALAIILATAFLATRKKASRIAGMLGVLLVAEALVYFAVPFLSFPSHSRLDEKTIAFIKENLGFQRIVGSEDASIRPNYGSYFGFALLHWVDLPVPKLSVNYARSQLDPFFAEISYTMEAQGLTELQRIQRKALFRQRLDRYAQTGVKYITSSVQPAMLSLLPDNDDHQSLILQQSQQLEMTTPFAQDEKTSLTGLSTLIGTYSGTADGKLAAKICHAEDCVQGVSDLATARDNAPLEIHLDRPLPVAKGDAIKIVFEKQGGVHPVVLWMATLPHTSEEIRVQTDGEGLGSQPGMVPRIEFRDSISDKVRLVHKGINFNLYELPDVKPYFEAEGCTLTATSRDEIKASCAAPSRLMRLELAMPGWWAYVNDTEVQIGKAKEIFQEVALPKGDSTVRFVFMPTGMKLAIGVSLCTLVAVLCVLGYALVEWHKKPRMDQ